MRLIFTMLLALILLAVFCNSTAQNQHDTGKDSKANPHIQSKHELRAGQNCTLSFKQFKAKYSKRYASLAQQKYRQHIFYTNRKMLNLHNIDPLRTFNMKSNSFLDVEKSEFREVYTKTYRSNNHSWNISKQIIRKNKEKSSYSVLNASQEQHNNVSYGQFQGWNSYNQTQEQSNENHEVNPSRRLQQIPMAPTVEIDWTLYSGKVKFQGTCGACYAFSAVDTLAAINNIKNFGFFAPLSIQQVVDCSQNGLTFGCKGGYLEGAYTYIQMYGITLQSSYPYTYVGASVAGKCKLKGGPFKISSFSPIQEGNCNAIIQELAYGPISVGISGYNLQYYGQGIFNECSNQLDHAVMIVGFKSEMGWRIKNSWGVDWGELGYGWIAEGNTCGICNMAVSIRL